MSEWNPEHYLQYAGERGRPFVELLARVGGHHPDRVVDLGCGPGNLTRLLRERWPAAEVVGVDASAAMIDRARAGGGGVDYRHQELHQWLDRAERAGATVDVLLSNATLQWIPDHLALLPRLLRRTTWLAIQVPGNFAAPSHTILRELSARPEYAEYTSGAAVPCSHEPEEYLEAVLPLTAHVDAWETTYRHVLSGPDPVFTWVGATGARPTLDALPPGPRGRFETEYRELLGEAYPRRRGRVVLPFRRIFLVASSDASGEGEAR
ncbi:methyltransferase domain-containing protein [Nocardioides insulae]|uniref:methyltransferase domain-containing protein n=1 Tax=Nocardioides insulae TaxID=394734 RepID=UPI0003F9463B|nr:methyltransferase domain-containing protein [Nocardioides insulae]